MFERLDLLKKEKREKDIYDIINERTKKYNKEFLLLIPRLASFVIRLEKLKNNGKSTDELEKDLFKMVQGILPAVIDCTHYTYELFNEIDNNYGDEKLLEYVETNEQDRVDFAFKYNKNKNMMLKLMAFFAILKNEGITMEDFSDTEIATQMISGKKISDIIEDKFYNLSYDAEESIEEIFDEKTSYSDLSSEVHNIVEEYHMNYMNENIYPYLGESNSRVHDEQRVLKLASKLGKNSKFRL